jgi:vitamin B12 transporter
MKYSPTAPGHGIPALQTLSVCFALPLFSLSTVHADDQSELTAAEQQRAVVITARRIELDAATESQQVQSVAAPEMEQYGTTNNPLQAVQRQAGVFVVDSPGGTSVLSIRGTANGDNQILLDGIPFNDPSTPNGQVAFSALPGSMTQRVEILKGSQPIYGTRAVGGVFNYQSLRPTDAWQALGRFEVGNRETFLGEAQVAGPLTESLGLAVTATGYRTEGFSAQTDAGSEFGSHPDAEPGDPLDLEEDHYRKGDATARLEYQQERLSLYISGIVAKESHQFDDFGQPEDDYSKQDTEWYRLAGGGQIDLGETSQVVFDVAYTELNRDSYGFSFPPPDFSPTRSVTRYKTGDLYASARFHVGVSENWDVIAGLDTLQQSMKSPTVDESANLTGAHVQALATYGDVSFDGTARFEEQTDAGSIFTWRAAASYIFGNGRGELFASAASGFRAPSLFELYDPNFGNGDLSAQENLSFDIGHRTMLMPGLHLTNTLFRIEYTDLISSDPVTFQSINIEGDSFTQGIENALEYRPEDGLFTADLYYTYNKVEDNNGDTPSYKPEHTVGFQGGVHWRAADAWFAVTVDYIDGYKVFGGEVDSRTLVGAVAEWSPVEYLTVYTRVRNLFDEVYEPNTGYSGEPLSAVVGLKATY